MGLDVYREDQVHGREELDIPSCASVARIVESAKMGSIARGVHPYGDTMFNIVQLQSLIDELNDMYADHPELASDIEDMVSLSESVIRARGYIWICGD